jgi:hypothetical protein
MQRRVWHNNLGDEIAGKYLLIVAAIMKRRITRVSECGEREKTETINIYDDDEFSFLATLQPYVLGDSESFR